MCFELMDTPFPTQGNNSTLLSKYSAVWNTGKNEAVHKSFNEVLCKPVACHYITRLQKKIVYFCFQQHKCEYDDTRPLL